MFYDYISLMSNLNDEDESKVKADPAKKEEEKELSVQEKLKNTEDKLLRSLAELENQRNRFEKDIKEAIEFGGFSFAKENLAILDNLQRAHNSIKNDPNLKSNKDLDKFLKNIEIIEKDLISIFKKNKIERINCLKKKFDPNFHQAMNEVEDGTIEPGTIVQEMQAGYMYRDRLLRPSLVAVSKKSEKKEDKNDDKSKKNK